jgi:hypothetical protein
MLPRLVGVWRYYVYVNPEKTSILVVVDVCWMAIYGFLWLGELTLFLS